MKRAVVIGAGPAGLTAASELLSRTDCAVLVLEATGQTGGISQTVEYKGNRMDIGGHRFFSKSDRVMDWWLRVLPVEEGEEAGFGELRLTYHGRHTTIHPETSQKEREDADRVMLVRNRLSRIYYGRKFYAYPVRLDKNTIRNLGLKRIALIAWSYLKARIHPVKPEKSLEDFFINRFGRELYLTFFRDYTEKVWGVPCNRIRPEWGSQRVKGLSVSTALWHALKSIFPREAGLRQKGTETSLIERFLYPKLGPGQLWEEVARRVTASGGKIRHHCRVVRIDWKDSRVAGVWFLNESGEEEYAAADYLFSTMPVRELIAGMGDRVPEAVREVASGLEYRDFIALGLLFSKMEVCSPRCEGGNRVPDNWIYIQEADVMVGRVQVFNNWSPHMVKDSGTVWLGLEYFCREGDALWNLDDQSLIRKGIEELGRIGFCRAEDFIDGTVVRMPKTYPAYFGTYDRFEVIREFTDQIDNLFLLGRNGMHRYNNQDHSMLTAMTAVDLIVNGHTDKAPVWAVNTEEEYHESASK